MKKIILLLTGATLLMAGCAKVQTEEVVPDEGKRIVTLNAAIDKPDTRVSVTISGQTATYSWQEEDRILVQTIFTNELGTMYSRTDASVTEGSIGSNGGTANFDVELDSGETLGKYAFYPLDWQSWVWSEDEVDFGMSSDYYYREGVTNMPMLGTITSNGARFRAVGGLLMVTIEEMPLEAHMLRFSVDDKKIAGAFPVIDASSSHPQINAVDFDDDYPDETDGNTITIYWDDEEGGDPEGGEGGMIGLRSPMTFYIPLPCGMYNNLTFSVCDYSENPLFTRIARMDNNGDGICNDEEGIEIGRNEIVVAPTLTFTWDQNLPKFVDIDFGPYEWDLDDDGVLNVDQFDDAIEFNAKIRGKYNWTLEEFDPDLVSCQLVNMTDPNQIVRTPVDFVFAYDYDFDNDFDCSEVEFNVSIPTDNPGEFKLEVSYGTLTPAESFKVKVYPVVPIPAALGEYWEYRYNYYPSVYINSTWFKDYWNKDTDGNVYLKIREASSRTEALPDYAFRGSFLSEDKGGSFEAFENFTQITSIPTNAFWGCEYMSGIKLPSGVTSIGTYAFRYCRALTGIVLPNGLTTIGNYAFSDCSHLASIQLPSGVTSIADFSFSACYDLSSVNLDNVLSIGTSAFSGCESLTGPLQIGGATIGTNAFNSCTSLQSVTIGNTTAPGADAMIGASAFYGCSSLSEVNLPNSLSSIGDAAFNECSQLTSIVLPTSLETIGTWAFRETGLSSLTIPASVTSIGRGAFQECALTYVIMEGETPANIGEGATDPDPWWSIFDAGVTIYVPASAVGTYQTAWPVLASRIVANPQN